MLQFRKWREWLPTWTTKMFPEATIGPSLMFLRRYSLPVMSTLQVFFYFNTIHFNDLHVSIAIRGVTFPQNLKPRIPKLEF